MKQVVILALLAFLMLPAFESYVQATNPMQTTQQTLSKQQQRQAKRNLRRQARAQADQQAFNAAIEAMRDRNWVLMANTLYGPQGAAIPVSDNTNFILFKGNTVYVQLAFDGIAGPNGLGGITVEGIPSQITTNTDRHGNITYSFYVNGTALTAQVIVNLYAGSNNANATVYPMTNGNNLTFSGTLVPTSQSGIFRSGFISF